MSAVQLTALAPLIAVGALAVLLMIAVAVRRHAGVAQGLTALGLAAALALIFVAVPSSPTPVTPLLVIDGYALFFTGLVLLAALAVTLLSGSYRKGRGPRAEEYYILLVLAALGACVLTASRHFVSLFLGIELLSVALYGLVAFERRRAQAIEAGVKYLVLAALSSAFLLFGIALLYARVGALDLSGLARVLGGDARMPAWGGALPGARGVDALILAGLALVFVGFGFKLALVPFHMWTPDIYQGAPAPVTAFVATASKGAVLAVLLRFTAMVDLSRGDALWTLLALVAGASMFAGNLLALRQASLKRLLAYSSIAHLGYVLVALLAAGAAAAAAVAFYLLAYTVTTLGAFGVIAVLSGGAGASGATGPAAEATGDAGDREGDVDDLAAYAGLGRRRPWLAGVLAAMLFSLAGIPLTAGFIGKFLVLAAGAGAAMWTLLVILAVNSAIGIYYYLRVVVAMYLQPGLGEATAAGSGHARPTDAQAPHAHVSLADGATLAGLTALLVLLGVVPGPALRLIARCCAGLF
jgi:NADH-quinone oxidoreductase subunit N